MPGDRRPPRLDAACRPSRSTPPSARDFDDAISAERLGAIHGSDRVRVWVHIADVSAYVPEGSLVDREAQAARHERVRARAPSSRCCREALSNDACSLVPGRERAGGDGRARACTGPQVAKAAFYRSLIRSDERLTMSASTGSSPGASGRASRGASRCTPRARWRGARARTPRGPQRRADARLRRARVLLRRATGNVSEILHARADRVPPPDRAPDDRRQRGGRAAAVRARDAVLCIACTSGPSPSAWSAWSTSSPRWGYPRRPCRRAHVPSQAAELMGEISRASRPMCAVCLRVQGR